MPSKTKGFERTLSRLRHMEGFFKKDSPTLGSVLDRFGQELKKEIEREIKAQGLVRTGRLLNSIRLQRKALWLEASSDAPYAARLNRKARFMDKAFYRQRPRLRLLMTEEMRP